MSGRYLAMSLSQQLAAPTYPKNIWSQLIESEWESEWERERVNDYNTSDNLGSGRRSDDTAIVVDNCLCSAAQLKSQMIKLSHHSIWDTQLTMSPGPPIAEWA